MFDNYVEPTGARKLWESAVNSALKVLLIVAAVVLVVGAIALRIWLKQVEHSLLFGK